MEIDNYLGEIARLLRPGGGCVATFFLYDEERLEKINGKDAGITLHHTMGDNCRYFNAEDPLHAIAFEKAHMESMIAGHGFEVRSFALGHWAGGGAPQYQDIFSLVRM